MKKSLNPLVTALIGLFVGGLLVFVYFNSKQPSAFEEPEKSKESFVFSQKDSKKARPIKIEDARKMIDALYKYMVSKPDSTPFLFKRSFALSLDDLQSAINIIANPTDSVKVRIYPGLRIEEVTKKPILSFILVAEKNGILVWGTNPNSLQDYWGPCPKDCPIGNDLFNEGEWQRTMGRHYEKP